jgi:hypothetical protein
MVDIAMGKANLTYYIFEGVLAGTVNGRFIHIFTYSGGGSGYNPAHRKATNFLRDSQATNNPYRTGQLTNEARNIRGGPIPPGKYIIKKPSNRDGSKAARLEPINPVTFFKRTGRDGGFLIHGRGPKGSDGCLVPVDPSEFQRLMDGLEKDDGGTLWVLETMAGDMFA